MRLAFSFLLTLLIGTAAFCAAAPAAYTGYCTPCHRTDGKPNSNAKFKSIPDLGSKAVQELSDEELFETIARGTKHKDYPHAFVYRGLKEKDVQDLVKYIRTLAPASK